MSNPRTIRKLSETLGLLNRGAFTEKCDEQFNQALEILEALPAQKGEATLTITVKLIYNDGQVDIKPNLKTKLPEDKPFNTTTFWSLDGGLSVQHPSQTEMWEPKPTFKLREAETA